MWARWETRAAAWSYQQVRFAETEHLCSNIDILLKVDAAVYDNSVSH